MLSSTRARSISLAGYTQNSAKQSIVAFSSVSDFTIRLPSQDIYETRFNLTVTIRDTLYCLTSVNLPIVTVTADVPRISQLVESVYNSTAALNTDSLVRLLSAGNQNTVTQLITSLSQYFNQLAMQNTDDARSRKQPRLNRPTTFESVLAPLDDVPFASIGVSSLTSSTYPQVTIVHYD